VAGGFRGNDTVHREMGIEKGAFAAEQESKTRRSRREMGK